MDYKFASVAKINSAKNKRNHWKLELLSFKKTNKYFDIAPRVNNRDIYEDNMEDNVSCKN